MTESVLSASSVRSDQGYSTDDWADVILRALASTNEPLAAAKLRDKLTGPYQRTAEELEAKLRAMAGDGTVFQFAPYRSKADRYWDRSIQEYAAELMKSDLVERFETKSELKKRFKARLKGLSDKEIFSLADQLVSEGTLFKGSLLVGRSVRYSASPIDERVLLNDAIERIANRFKTTPVAIQRLMVDEFQKQSVTYAETASKPDAHESIDSPTDFVLVWIKEHCIENSTDQVSLASVRRSLEFKLNPSELENAIRTLRQTERIDLTVHPDPGSLEAEERSARMLTGESKVYDMVVLRREQ